jgi:thymidylate kinase
MTVVCIVGLDGAGKTTLATKLVSMLRAHGQDALYLYGRPIPRVSRLLSYVGRRVLLRGHDPWRDYGEYEQAKKRHSRNRFLAATYATSVILDYLPQMWLRMLPHILTSRVVVVDRYAHDTVITDLAAHVGLSPKRAERAITALSLFLPRPDVIVLVNIPPDLAITRKKDIPSVDFLVKRAPLYEMIDGPSVVHADGSLPASEVAQVAFSRVMKVIGA